MANKRLPYNTPIDENSMYLVQYEFKNYIFCDIKLSKLKYMSGRAVIEMFNNGVQWLKASKLVDGENIGIMHTYKIMDQHGIFPNTIDHEILKFLGRDGECVFTPRVCSSNEFHVMTGNLENLLSDEDRAKLRENIDMFDKFWHGYIRDLAN